MESPRVSEAIARLLPDRGAEVACSTAYPQAVYLNGEDLMKSLQEVLSKLEPLPRDVFRFRGTYAEFREAMVAAGFMVSDKALVAINCGVPSLPMVAAMQVYASDGFVWVAANLRDIQDTIAGNLPFHELKKAR